MSSLDGVYETVAKTPMGDQKAQLTIATAGDTFTGRTDGSMGAGPISGTISGSKLAWKMAISVPMSLTLDCQATVVGDRIDGTVTAGVFGSFPLTGKKIA